MNELKKGLILIFFVFLTVSNFGQNVVEEYSLPKNDSLRIGKQDSDFLKFISMGFTLSLPENGKPTSGVIIILEDSQFDNKNKRAKQLYSQSNINGYAVLSVSTEIPLDFYFSENSALTSQSVIKKVFDNYKLPNKNIFFIGVGLSGHRAMKYIEFMKKNNYDFQLNIKGIVLCNTPLDWVSQWNEFKREIRINRNDLWEANFLTYMLETHLNGTPKNNIEAYYKFSSYSYSDEKNENINYYKNYAFRAYIDPAIKYWLEKKGKTMYDSNSPDMVGLLAELKLAGNENTELIVLQPDDNKSEKKNPDSTWNSIDKSELLTWIKNQSE